MGAFSFPNFCCHGVSGILFLISTNDIPVIPETISILCAGTFSSDYIPSFSFVEQANCNSALAVSTLDTLQDTSGLTHHT
jgi:hypothetical protein